MQMVYVVYLEREREREVGLEIGSYVALRVMQRPLKVSVYFQKEHLHALLSTPQPADHSTRLISINPVGINMQLTAGKFC